MAVRNGRILLEAGTRAPGFQLERLGGGTQGLGDLISGGPALLAFFKISCPVCQMTFPYLERLHTPGRLAIYGISQNDADPTREFAEEFGIGFPMLLDSQDAGYVVSNAYGISSVPTMFLVEPDGVIARVVQGWSRKDIEELGARAGVAPIGERDNVPAWKAG
ncbi:MAG TPA: TlpA disulfide reductase family protein [Candidatus Limnocylindrales bacterium]|nr:TlpA disulfide reductase family protein [Candidatus Limnocylindrales bacterium]